MSNTPHNVLQQARQGNPDAIAALMNQHLQARGITAQVTQQGDALHVLLESSQSLAQQDLVDYIKKGVSGLSLKDIHHLHITGKQAGHNAADWTEDIDFNSPTTNGFSPPVQSSVEDVPAFDDGLESALGLSNGYDADSELDFDLGDLDDADSPGDLDLNDISDLDDNLDLELGAALDETDGLGSDDLLDLGLDTDDLDSNNPDFGELDLELTDASTDIAEDFDLSLDVEEFQETTDELNAVLSDLDMPATAETNDSASTPALDDDLDLGLEADLDNLATTSMAYGAAADFDLDLELDISEPALNELDLATDEPALDSLDLDLEPDTPSAASPVDREALDLELPADIVDDADLDLSLDTSMPAESDLADSELDLDLEMASEEASTGLDLDFDSTPIAKDASDLDLDLDLDTSAIAERADSDLNLEAPSEDLTQAGFDLDLDTFPRDDANAADELNPDLDTTATTAPPEFDLGADAEIAASAPEFDLGLDHEPIAAEPPELDLDFDVPASSLDTNLADSEFPELELSDSSPVAADLDSGESAESAEPALPESLSLGEGLDGDLWDSKGASISVETPLEGTTDDVSNDIEWDLEDPNESFPDIADTAGVGDEVVPDLNWEPTDPEPASPMPNLEAELDSPVDLPPFEESDTTPDFGRADLSSAKPSASSIKDAEPIDLMLSEDLELSDDDSDDEFPEFPPQGSGWVSGEELQNQGEEGPDQQAPSALDVDLGLAAAAAAQNIPQSPVNKLLSEDAGLLDTVYSAETEDLTDIAAEGPEVENFTLDPGGNADLPGEDFSIASQDSGVEELPPAPEDTSVADQCFEVDEDLGLTSVTQDPQVEYVAAETSATDGLAVDSQDALSEEAFAIEDNDSEELSFEAQESALEDFPVDLHDNVAATFEAQDAPMEEAPLSTEDFEPEDTVEGFDDASEWVDTEQEGSVPEAGLRPEDFPLFGGGVASSVEADDMNPKGADTLELDASRESDSAIEGDSSTSDDDAFPIEPDAYLEENQSLNAFAAEVMDNSSGATVDDELVNDEDLNTKFGSDVDADWLEGDQPDATDEFIDGVVQGQDEPVSTSVTLTDEDLDNLDNSDSRGSSTNWLVGLGLGVVVLGLIGILFNTLLNNRRPTEPVAEPPVEMATPAEGEPETPAEEPAATELEPTEPETTTPEPEPAEPAAALPAEAQYFREAVNAAQNAANLAQTASTGAEWQAVADSWAKAIDLMKQVPESDPNYAVAQQKAVDYQPNLEYAQKNAEQF